MIITTTNGSHYMIGFSRTDQPACEYCVFRETFLPLPVINKIRSLGVFNASKPQQFDLTRQQEEATQSIFDKMKEEKNSDDAYSAGLQKTYLLELLHGIIKSGFIAV
jgi:AraC family transcriptional regulator, transcriptional activator of pobA